MASVFKRGGRANRRGSYYIAYYDENGKRRTVKGCTDKEASEALARKLEADALLRRKGVINPKDDQYAAAERVLLAEHLDDFRADLLKKHVTKKHANTVFRRASRVIELCGAKNISKLDPVAAQGAIKGLSEANPEEDTNGFSLQTCNHHIRAIKQFSRWLRRNGRSRENILAHLSTYNAALDVRHQRRSLTDKELLGLFEKAAEGPVVCNIPGPDRAVLYRLAVGTGFRASELLSLSLVSFDLDSSQSTITVKPGYSKRRRLEVQPIRRDLAELLRPWLASKPQGEPLFGDLNSSRTAKMMRTDLKAAGIDYRDAEERVADFHSLRHTYITRLVQSGASVKVAQELARHSTPTLTLGRYSHLSVYDEAAALDALPPLESPKPAEDTAQATGTYGDAVPPAGNDGTSAQRQAQRAGGISRHPASPRCMDDSDGKGSVQETPRNATPTNGPCQQGYASTGTGVHNKLAEGRGFEPPVRLPVQRFSRPPPSTTRPPLRGWAASW